MDEWLHPEGNRQPQGWVIPESLLTRVAEPVAGVADEQPPADRLPDYSQPASYANSTHTPPQSGGGHTGPPQPVPPAGYQPYRPPTGHPIQGGYLPGGSGLPPWMATQPVRKRGSAKLVVAIAGGLVLSLLVLAVVLGALQRAGYLDTSDGNRLTLPSQTSGYVRISTPVALDLGKTLSDQVKSVSGTLWSKPMVGIYGSSSTGSPSLVFIGGDSSSNPKLHSQLKTAASLNEAIDGFLAGAKISPSTSYPPGKFGGLLRCGTGNSDQAACIWVDHSTIGTLILLQPPSLDEVAAIALNFRNATEH